MTKNSLIYIEHILTEISVLQAILAQHSKTTFCEDEIAWRAAVYAIQCISEAARRLPDEWLAPYTDLPWRGIKGIGNPARHEYYAVDDEIIWNILSEGIIPLRAAMLNLRDRFPYMPNPA